MIHVWWGVTGNCRTCGAELLKPMVLFSSDGEMRFLFDCPKCNIVLDWRIFATALADKAKDNDEERQEKREKRVLTPPTKLLTPPFPPVFTAEDKKWEKAMGIKPDDEPT